MDSQSVIVIGGGVVGRSIALSLQVAGHEVTVLDPPLAAMPASLGNAGHIAVEQTAPLASAATLRALPRLLFGRDAPAALPLAAIRHWLPFGLRMLRAAAPPRFRAGEVALTGLLAEAVPAWRRLLDVAAAGHLMREEGHLVLSESERGLRNLLEAGRREQVLTSAVPLGPEVAAALSTRFETPILGGLRYAGTAQIVDLPHLLSMLANAFEARGGVSLSERAVSVSPAGEAVVVTMADGRTRRAARAVIAAGIHSRPLLAGLGLKVPLIAERGYHIEIERGAEEPPEPPIVFADRNLLLASFTGRTRLTSVTEFTHPDAPPNERHWRRLERNASDLGIRPTQAWRRWVGSRPTFPDYLPALGRLDHAPQIAYAFGHQHLGLTLAARTAELITALMDGPGEKGCDHLSSLSIERFGMGTPPVSACAVSNKRPGRDRHEH